MYWWLDCCRWFPPCFRCFGRRIWGRCLLSSRFTRSTTQFRGRCRISYGPCASRRCGLHSSRSGSTLKYFAWTPISIFGYTIFKYYYVHPHPYQLIQVIAKVIIINLLHQNLNFVFVVFELGLSFIKLLDDVADLSTCLSFMSGRVLCVSAAFSLRSFLFSFFLSLRRSSLVSFVLNSRHCSF